MKTERGKWAALAVLAAASFIAILDGAVVNIALPSIQHDLHFSASSIQWAFSAYLLTYGGLLLLSMLAGRSASRSCRPSPTPICAGIPPSALPDFPQRSAPRRSGQRSCFVGAAFVLAVGAIRRSEVSVWRCATPYRTSTPARFRSWHLRPRHLAPDQAVIAVVNAPPLANTDPD